MSIPIIAEDISPTLKIVSHIFHRAAELEESIDRLRERQYDHIPNQSPPLKELQAAPNTAETLAIAESNQNPAVVSPDTRAKFLKRLLLRLMRIYYRGQVEFNTAVFRVLAAWDTRLRKLLEEISDISRSLDERTADKLLKMEQRWEDVESKQTSDIHALGERIGVGEADFVRLEETILAHKKNMRELQTQLNDVTNSLEKMDSSLAGVVKDWDYFTNTLQRLATDVQHVQKLHHQHYEKQVLSPEMYFEFENINRGKREDVVQKQQCYLPILRRFAEKFQAAKFVDLGCGRGELLQIAYHAGIDLVGYDHNPMMVAHCRSLGLKASEEDLMDSLVSYGENSLAGVIAIQVIEHLTYSQIASLLKLAREKIRPGGCIILETINPLSVYAMRYFYMDPTHRQPVPSATCEFLLKAYGYVDLETLWLNSVEDDPGLAALEAGHADHPLSKILFGFQDYAVIAMKP